MKFNDYAIRTNTLPSENQHLFIVLFAENMVVDTSLDFIARYAACEVFGQINHVGNFHISNRGNIFHSVFLSDCPSRRVMFFVSMYVKYLGAL